MERKKYCYRYVATTVEGFVQQLATVYVPRGYRHFVQGRVPEGKSPEVIDQQIISKYQIAVSPSTRYRRKQEGLANLQYLRYGRDFIIIATEGIHEFRVLEANAIKDVQVLPIHFRGYSITYKRGHYLLKGDEEEREVDDCFHCRVQIGKWEYSELRKSFIKQAKSKPLPSLWQEFQKIPYEPYAPVRRQLLRLVKRVNIARKGLAKLPYSVLRYQRRIVKPFE